MGAKKGQSIHREDDLPDGILRQAHRRRIPQTSQGEMSREGPDLLRKPTAGQSLLHGLEQDCETPHGVVEPKPENPGACGRGEGPELGRPSREIDEPLDCMPQDVGNLGNGVGRHLAEKLHRHVVVLARNPPGLRGGGTHPCGRLRRNVLHGRRNFHSHEQPRYGSASSR